MASLTRVALRHPRIAVLLILVLTFSTGAGLSRTWTNVGYRVFLGPDNESIKALDSLIDRFGGGLPILIAWECGDGLPCAHALDEASIRMANELEQVFLDHPLVRAVASPASAEIIVPNADGFDVRSLLEAGSLPPDSQGLLQRAQSDPMWTRTLVSDDGSVGAIVVQLASSESHVTAEVVPYIREALASESVAPFQFYLIGDPIDFVVSGGQMQADTPRVMVALVAALILTGWMLLRSFRAVALSLGVAGLSLVWAMGVMAWLGWPEMELTQALRPGILVVALCDAIHLVSRYAERSTMTPVATLVQRRTAISTAADDVQTACLLTSATTAIAFLSFTTSGSEAFVRFGIVAALGVVSALILTFSALPLALLYFKPDQLRSTRAQSGWREVFGRLNRFIRTHPKAILLGALLLSFSVGAGMGRLRVDLDERELVGENSQVVQWASFVEDRLRKSDSLELIVRSPSGVSIIDPESVHVLEQAVATVEESDSIDHGRSIIDLLSTLDQAFNARSPGMSRPGDSLESNAQLLLLLEMGGSLAAGTWIQDDQEARLSFEADPLSTSRRFEILEEIRKELDTVLPPGWTYEISGPFAVYLAFADIIHQTQLTSFVTAFVVITSVLLLYLFVSGRNARRAIVWTMIALVPSLLPVVVTLGAMGLLDIPLDVGTAMVGAVIIGIAVDDSIHLIAAFQKFRRRGANEADAIAQAMLQTGQAVVTSSIALSVGFFALTLSSWQSIASFGLLSGLAILMALVSDLLVLPAIVLVVSRAGSSDADNEFPVTDIPKTATRSTITMICVGIASLAALAVHPSRSTSDPSPILPCEIHTTGSVVPFSTLYEECPLRAGDVVRSVRLGSGEFEPRSFDQSSHALANDELPAFSVDRSGGDRQLVQSRRHRRSGLDPVIVWLLLAISVLWSLIVVWLSSAQAALPYGIWTVSLGGLGALIASRPDVDLGVVVLAVCLGAVSASSLQLSLMFPARNRLMADIPGVSWGIYLYGLAIAAAIIWGNARYPAIWRTALAMAMASFAVLVARVVIDAARSANEGDVLDDRRARSAAIGMGLVALVVLASVLHERTHPHTAGFASIAVPLPIGFALIRYQHFASRVWILTITEGLLNAVLYVPVMLFLLVSAGVSVAADESTAGGRLIALAMMGILLAIAIQRLVRVGMNAVLDDEDEALRRAEFAVSAELEMAKDEIAIATTLATGIGEALGARGASVALLRSGTLELVAGAGGRPAAPTDMKQIREAIESDEDLLHTGPEGGATDWTRSLLQRYSLSVVCPIRWRGALSGVVFVGPRHDGASYSSDRLAYVARVCRGAGAALNHLSQQAARLSLERGSTLDWVGAGLMHSVGKPLTIATRKAERLIARQAVDDELRELATVVQAAASEALSGIAILRRQAGKSTDDANWVVPFDEIVKRSIERAHHLHPDREITNRLGAELPAVPNGEEIRRILTNLLDNALLATSACGIPPEIRVARRSSWLTIDVVDHGVGMSAELLGRATEAFFTTRRASGGSGIGLLDVKSTVERLGGEFNLESSPGRGTVATIRLPCPRTRAP